MAFFLFWLFFFPLREACVAAQTLGSPHNGYIARGTPRIKSPISDATEDNSAIRLIDGLSVAPDRLSLHPLNMKLCETLFVCELFQLEQRSAL